MLFTHARKEKLTIVQVFMVCMAAVSLCLLVAGLTCYILFGSQWVWSFVQYLALLPALFTWSLLRKMRKEEERQRVEQMLRHLAVWLPVPTLAAITLDVVASIVPATKAPVLHDVQFLSSLVLGLGTNIVRRRMVNIYSQRLKRDVSEIVQAVNHTGPSSDDLLPPERHGQELESLEHETSSFNTM